MLVVDWLSESSAVGSARAEGCAVSGASDVGASDILTVNFDVDDQVMCDDVSGVDVVL